jgi:hypothetical protein
MITTGITKLINKKNFVFEDNLPEIIYNREKILRFGGHDVQKYLELKKTNNLTKKENKNLAAEVFNENKDDYGTKLTPQQFKESPVAKTFQTGLLLPSETNNEFIKKISQENKYKKDELDKLTKKPQKKKFLSSLMNKFINFVRKNKNEAEKMNQKHSNKKKKFT